MPKKTKVSSELLQLATEAAEKVKTTENMALIFLPPNSTEINPFGNISARTV